MANKTLNVRIQNKYDTEANWASKNPVLLKGEAAYSSDKNGLYKIGDGTSKWSDLKYGLSSELDALTNNKSDFKFSHHVIENTGTAYYTKLFELTADSTYINYNYEFAIAERNGGIAYVHIYLYSNNNKYFTDALIRYRTDSGYADFITDNMKGFVYKDTTKQYSKLEVWFKVNAWEDVRIMEKTVSDRGCKFTWASNFTRNAAFPTDATSIVEPKPQTVAWGNITGKPSTYYTHPSYTARSSGLYKVTVDATGHVSGATAVSKADITALGIPGTDTNTWRGVQNNLTSTATDQSLSAAQGKILNETKTTRHDWNTIIKCATWSRLCYVPYSKTVVGSSFLLNIRGTRNAVVYNDTFMVKAHHSSRGNITKISGCNYSTVSIRIVCDSSGNCYVEFFDSANGATNATTQTVYCTLIEVAVGSITKYTSFTNGTTLPANFTVAATLTTNTNSLQGNLTWGEITGKPTTFTPSSHTHDDRYYTESEVNSKLAGYLPISGGSLTGNLNLKPASGEGGEIHLDASTANRTENGIILDQQGGNFRIFGVPSADGTTKTGSGTPLIINPYSKTITGGYTLTGALSGNASTASKWLTARTLTLTGSVTGSVSIDGSGNVSLATTTNHTHSQYYDSGISRAANTVLATPNGANGTATFRKLVAADIPTLTKSKISDFPTSLAPTAGSNNYVRVYNSKDIGNSSTVTFNDLAKQHFAMGMINGATDNPYGAAKWAHGISMAWANGVNTSWISQIALGVQEGTGMWYRTKQGTIVGADWTRVLDSSNYTSYAATKGHTHSSIKDIGNGTDTTFAYSKAGMNYADYTWLAAWNGNELRAINKSQFATAGHGHNAVGLPRVTKDANGTAQKNIFKVEEFSNGTTYNLPSNAWYHIMTNQGADTNYATQLALGMTTENIAYRIRNGSSTTWGSWLTVLTSSNYSSYAAPKSHSHNYAGSSSAGGAATSANKLNTNAGSATQPVYFSGGVPVACTYTLGKSVPADAKFTDTNTTYPIMYKTIDANFATKFRTETKGNTNNGDYIATLRNDTASVANSPQYGSGLAFGRGDTHGYIYYNYSTAAMYVGAGNADKLNWVKQVSFTDHIHNYAGSSSAGGSANSAVKLATARTVSGGTDITISYSYDGSANSSANIGFYGSAANVGDTNNYPFHRFAKLDTITGSYIDKASTFYISQDYDGGGFGIVRIVLRTNNSSSVSTAEVRWLVRSGLASDSVQVGIYNVNGKTYADAFFKTQGTYASTVFRAIANGSRGTISRTWVMVNSSEVSGTTTTDAKTSTECYVNIAAAGTKLHKQAYTNIVSGSDSGTVSYSNSTGSASTSTKLTTARNIFGKSFNGTDDVAGQGLFYGTYTSTASNRFSNSGLQIRENGLVGKNQTDIGYAPTIGFHWSNRIAATLAFGSDGIFYFRKQNGTDRATIDANVNGAVLKLQTFKKGSTTETYGTQYPVYAQWEDDKNVLLKCDGYTVKTTYANSAGSATSAVKLDTSTAGSATQPVYFTGGKPVACTYTLGKSVPSNAVFTDTNNKMTQTAIASKDYTNWRTILWGASNSGTEGFTPTTVTDGAFTDTNLSYQPSTGTLRAKVFKGDLYQTTTIGNSTAIECSLNFLSNAKLSDGSYLAQNYRIVNDRKTDFVFGIKTKNNEWASYCQGTQVYFKNSSADISALAGKMLPPVLTDFSGSKDSPGAGTGRVLSIASNVDSKIIKFRIFTSSTATTATTVNVTYSTSDIRLKDNVKDTDIKDALSVINKMKIRQFDWKDDNKHQKIGFVADELEELDDKLVVGGGWEDEEHTQMNVKGVDTFYMMGYVVKGMQELSEQIKALTEENKELKKQIEGLKREG